MAKDSELVKRKELPFVSIQYELLCFAANDGKGWRRTRLAEGVGFEPTRERNPLPVFKTGALNHSATLP
jgi:hypothetical protein